MRYSVAFAALALAQAVLSSPVQKDTEITKEATFFTETPSTTERPSATKPDDELVSELTITTLNPATYEGPIIVVEPPPMFDPSEPRPGSIFVSDTGLVLETLPKPPPMSFARPEKLSAFDGSHVHPLLNPYPPEEYEFILDDAVYTDCAWVRALSTIGAVVTLLSVATIFVWMAERVLTTFWRNRRRDQHLARDLWAEDFAAEALFEEKIARRRSIGSSVMLH